MFDDEHVDFGLLYTSSPPDADASGHANEADLTTLIESNGATSLTEVDGHYFLNASGGAAGPQLSFGGAAVTAGQNGPWMPIAAEQTANGYEVVWKATGSDQYLVWATNSSGAYTGSMTGVVSGSSVALRAFEPGLQQDLNGDGVIAPTTVIESSGSTSLVSILGTYFLGGASGPQLSFGGAVVSAGQNGPWTPIGAEQTASGYEVAWKTTGSDHYLVWATNSSGGYTGSMTDVVSGGSGALQSLESSFHQDLNGDGTTGLATTTIESSGATSLTQVGDNYFLYASGSSSGPQLTFGAAAVTAGQNGPWTPIGAEHTASGYEVAWKATGSDLYLVWATDSSGAYSSTMLAPMPGGKTTLQSLETSFHQDLNGDGTTGPATTAIETNGATSLTQVADTYFLYASGGSSGPQLTFGGAAVTVGQNGPWTPIAAEQTANGYEVVWKVDGVDQYLVWATSSGGAYVSSMTGVVSGSSVALRSLEPGLQQDLNSDGVIAPTTVVENAGATGLVRILGTYFLGGASGPQLNTGTMAFTDGQYGGWTPIGAEQVSGGYRVAWKMTGVEQYTLWTTNSNGTYLGDIGAVAGTSWALQTREPIFQQDLNNDGRVGALVTPLETFGSISLTKVADAYFLYPVGGSSGPMLNTSGIAVTEGEFGGWAPFSAEQMTTGGYRVAWKMTGAELYTVWTTDGNGGFLNDIGAVSGSSVDLRSLEPGLQHDLNHDGVIAPTTVIESSGSTSLVNVLGTYFLGGVSGPQVNLAGHAAILGQFGPWTPIGAEQAGGGYEVVLKRTGIDQYLAWSTNGIGTYVSGSGILFGQSSVFESYELRYGQDLNADGLIGIPTPAFNIDVSYSGDPAYQSFFTAAAQRWEQVITGDLPGLVVPGYGFVDDLHITATVRAIDGVGGILGQASPEYYRTSGKIPITGVMTFDSADLANMASNGTLYSVILHEMGHVLGIGTMWDMFGLKSGSQYYGQNALDAYHLLTGTDSNPYVPLETTGGSGTAGVHWSEAVFGNELMTGYISGVPDPLSIVTIGALRDMGYTVNYSAADAYALPGHLQAAQVALAANDTSIAEAPEQAAEQSGPVAALGVDIALFVAPGDHREDDEFPFRA
jgi:hypothetical protein